MSERNIKTEVIDLLAELFPEFDRNLIEYMDLIDDLGMDSITFITIVVEVESRFDIVVPDDMLLLDSFKTVDSITQIIENELLSKTENV